METVTRQSKADLRSRLRGQRLQLSLAEVAERSRLVQARLLALPVVAGARRLLAYVSRGHEVATHNLIGEWLRQGRQVAVPAFDPATDTYRASLVEKFPDDLRPGKLDILEPKVVRPVSVDWCDVLIVPGVAFDGQGHRLGRGKGYFDRLLENAPGVKIGLAYDFEVMNQVPVTWHDVAMDLIVTETRVVHCKKGLINERDHHDPDGLACRRGGLLVGVVPAPAHGDGPGAHGGGRHPAGRQGERTGDAVEGAGGV